jgi:hypothetical protein
MKDEKTCVQKSEAFEKTMMSGLAIFAALAIIVLTGSGDLTGPLRLALFCLSVSLPFVIFQIACISLGVTQRHKFLLQVATVAVALVGVFALLIVVSGFVGVLFAVSCLGAYYLFMVFSAKPKTSEETSPADDGEAEDAKVA